MGELPQVPARCREKVELLLTLFADVHSLGANGAAACEFGASPETSPEQLCRKWFDEVYLPGGTYFDPEISSTVKGDADPAALAEFSNAFSEDELLQLERFHRFVELRIELLSKSDIAPADWGESPQWGHISKNARNTLELLRPKSSAVSKIAND